MHLLQAHVSFRCRTLLSAVSWALTGGQVSAQHSEAGAAASQKHGPRASETQPGQKRPRWQPCGRVCPTHDLHVQISPQTPAASCPEGVLAWRLR